MLTHQAVWLSSVPCAPEDALLLLHLKQNSKAWLDLCYIYLRTRVELFFFSGESELGTSKHGGRTVRRAAFLSTAFLLLHAFVMSLERKANAV